MNLSLGDAQDLVFKLKNYISSNTKTEVAICPPFVYLISIKHVLKDSVISVGAQNFYFKDEGAYTGEISPKMLKGLNIQMVIIGHSERRQFFHETDELINSKLKSALKHNLIPILCVGEDLKTREKGEAENWVVSQVKAGLKEINKNDMEKIIIAYEPIWAIGTGKICSGEDANKIIKQIRKTIKDLYDLDTSEKVRILYGGSIKSDNFKEHISFQDIDGGLVGGSSLSYEEFVRIIELADITCLIKG